MKLNELISPGDKIDIKLSYQIEQARMGSNIEVKTYKSSIYDFASNTSIEMSMPTDGSKMVLFQVGLRCEMIFYSKKGLYSCLGIVKDRIRKDNLYVLIVEIKTPLSKYQRREFFRVDCMIDMEYYNISEQVASLPTTEALFEEISKVDYIGLAISGVTLDISGGGIRFSSPVENKTGSYILMKIRLSNSTIDQIFYLVCKIISSKQVEHAKDRFSNRAKFIFKDIKDRELIVKFVLGEERRIRKKENG